MMAFLWLYGTFHMRTFFVDHVDNFTKRVIVQRIGICFEQKSYAGDFRRAFIISV